LPRIFLQQFRSKRCSYLFPQHPENPLRRNAHTREKTTRVGRRLPRRRPPLKAARRSGRPRVGFFWRLYSSFEVVVERPWRLGSSLKKPVVGE
jgi:hypothetical protein